MKTSLLLLALVACVAAALMPPAEAVGVDCNDRVTTWDSGSAGSRQCRATAADGHYLVCLGYAHTWTQQVPDAPYEHDTYSCSLGIEQ